MKINWKLLWELCCVRALQWQEVLRLVGFEQIQNVRHFLISRIGNVKITFWNYISHQESIFAYKETICKVEKLHESSREMASASLARFDFLESKAQVILNEIEEGDKEQQP